MTDDEQQTAASTTGTDLPSPGEMAERDARDFADVELSAEMLDRTPPIRLYAYLIRLFHARYDALVRPVIAQHYPPERAEAVLGDAAWEYARQYVCTAFRLYAERLAPDLQEMVPEMRTEMRPTDHPSTDHPATHSLEVSL